MVVKVLEAVLDYDGQPLQEGGKPLTWRRVISESLNTLTADSQNMTGEEKGKRYLLTMRAYNSDTPDFSVEEMAFIQACIDKVYNPLVAGRARELFNKQESVSKTEGPAQ